MDGLEKTNRTANLDRVGRGMRGSRSRWRSLQAVFGGQWGGHGVDWVLDDAVFDDESVVGDHSESLGSHGLDGRWARIEREHPDETAAYGQ